MKYIITYSGTDYAGRNRERGQVVENIEQIADFLATCHTYLDLNNPATIQLSEGSRARLVEWMNGTDPDMFFRTTGCGKWECHIFRTATSFDDYKTARDEAAKQKAHEHNQKRLEELHQPRKGWYRVTLELTGDGVFNCKDFTGEVIAMNGADAYNKAVAECRNLAPEYEPADIMGSGYSFEFLGVKTDNGFSVEKWYEWKENGTI